MNKQGFVDAAVGMLDYLDPILGFDLKYATEGCIHHEQVTLLYQECLDRASVHAPGTLRDAWNVVLDALLEIDK